MRAAFPSDMPGPKRGGVTRRLALPRRWPAIALVLLALLLRGGIPQGYMIGTDAAGAVAITPCPGQAMVMPVSMSMSMPMKHGAGHDHDGSPRGMPCPFAVLAAPAMPSAPAIVPPAPPVAAPAAATAVPSAFPGPEAAAPPPPATGPPLLS
jgi:hypothetical protein